MLFKIDDAEKLSENDSAWSPKELEIEAFRRFEQGYKNSFVSKELDKLSLPSQIFQKAGGLAAAHRSSIRACIQERPGASMGIREDSRASESIREHPRGEC